jgi:hypothetical protein
MNGVMNYAKCLRCGLVWLPPVNGPGNLTCPDCLATVLNPKLASGMQPPPIPVLPLEHEVKRDQMVGKAGVIVVMGVMFLGLLTLIFAGSQGAGAGGIIVIAMATVALAAIVVAAIGSNQTAPVSTSARRAIPPPLPIQVPSPQQFGAPVGSPGGMLDYQNPIYVQKKRLSGGQLFGQAIGGVIAGIVVCFGLFALQVPPPIPLFVPIAVGIGLCFVPRVRGLGIGLILSLPVGALIGIGLCFVMLAGSNFH